jgi:hypothetical protein
VLSIDFYSIPDSIASQGTFLSRRGIVFGVETGLFQTGGAMGSRCDSSAWREVPPAELDAFDRCLDDGPMDIEHQEWLTGGFSGSPVARIRFTQTGAAPAEAILKFCTKGEKEARKISAAYRSAPPAFSKAHMVKPLQNFPLHEWSAVLMEVAGGDLSSYKPIAEFSDKNELVSICAVVIKSLLGEWNAGTIRRNRDIEAGEFLEAVIGKDRLTEESDLISFVGQSRNMTLIQRAIQPDDVLLNPLSLIGNTADTKISAIIGFGHGDLSVHNVLVPTWPKLRAGGFVLIDYGSFGHEYPLARDPMYLLVSLATQWLRDTRLPSSRSHALIRELARAGPPVPDLGLSDYRKVIDTIFDTGRTWAATQAAMGGHWLPQSFLALAGAALTFIGRDIPDLEPAATNDWLFDLAAVVAKEHLTRYAPKGGALPAPARHAVPDDMLRAQPIDNIGPAAPSASTADTGQAEAERSTEGGGANSDRLDPHATELEGKVARLQKQLGTVGPPPVLHSRAGTGRWLVSLGYWTDMADSVLSEIASFTYENCNDPPDRFAQAVDDARSAIREILNQLPVDATTTKDVTTLANWTAHLWLVMHQLLRLSMEVCGLGHVLLAANKQITTDSPGTFPKPSGIPGDTGLEKLMVKLVDTRSALEPVVDGFLRQRPSDHAADLLLDRLIALFKELDRTYVPQSEGGQRVNLERIHNALRPAAIALSRLTGSVLSNDELSSIHKDLSWLLRALDNTLPINDPRDEQ